MVCEPPPPESNTMPMVRLEACRESNACMVTCIDGTAAKANRKMACANA